MIKSLMQGLNEKNMQAVVNTYTLNDFYYPTLFPMKEQNSLDWKALETVTGIHLAGDVVSRGASIVNKSREALTRLQGDIPKIAAKRIMNENELNEYRIALALSQGNIDQRRLVEAWAEDTNFVWNGVASRMEWIALQQISRGVVTFSAENNVGVVSEYNLDYQLGSQRRGYQTGSDAWSNRTTAKPVTKDLRTMVQLARAAYHYPKFAFMNENTFAKFVDTEEVQKMCASVYANIAGTVFTPSLEQVNTMLKSQAYLYGLQIVIIEQEVTIELGDGSRQSANPFVNDSVLLSETKVLGNTFWMKPVDMDSTGSVAVKVMNGHTCIKKFAKEEPLQEVTIGVANAIPAWSASQRSWLLDVEHNSFTL